MQRKIKRLEREDLQRQFVKFWNDFYIREYYSYEGIEESYKGFG